MPIIARRETIVIIFLLLIFGSALYPAIRHARREARDGIRRDEIAARKTQLEQYFNKHELYPLEFDASPHQYVVVEHGGAGATKWYLRAELENAGRSIVDYDAEAGRNYWYRVVRLSEATYYDICGGSYNCEL